MKATGLFWRTIFFALMGALTAAHSGAQSAGPRTQEASKIWFTPLSWVISGSTHKIDYSDHDFPNLLKADAPWTEAASRISVLTLPGNVVWSYPDRPTLVRFFHDHAFKTAFSFGMLFDDGLCQKRVEGISQDHDFNHESVTIARLWKEAGGTLDYVVMDAPLGYGHFLEATCGHSIEDVARRATATLKGIRAYFPNAQVVDAEGPGRLPNSDWLSMMDEWLNVFEQKAGHPIDAIALDLHWTDLRAGNSWQDTCQRSAANFHKHGVQTGLIVNDDQHGPGVTDATWMDANRRHITDVANLGGLGLDFLAINGWTGHPRNNLPENDPLAYSSLVDFTFHAFHRQK
jgi:hypothetical protein